MEKKIFDVMFYWNEEKDRITVRYSPISIFSPFHIVLRIQNENVIRIFKLEIFNKASEKYVHHVHVNLPKSTPVIPISKSEHNCQTHPKNKKPDKQCQYKSCKFNWVEEIVNKNGRNKSLLIIHLILEKKFTKTSHTSQCVQNKNN